MNVTVVTVIVLGKLQTELYYKNETDAEICHHLKITYNTFIVSSFLKATNATFKSVSTLNQFKL